MPLYRDLPYLGPPRHYGGYRTQKKLLVVHCTANTASARDEAGYAQRRPDSVSSHYYVDDRELVQSLNTDLVAWHAGNTEGNNGGIGYEFTGHVTWSRSRWLADPDDIHAAARQMARECRHWDIPARWLTVAQLRAGAKGLTTHDDVRRAWGGSHTDPGPGFPRDVLLDAVKRALLGDDDMPIRTALGKAKEQTLPWNEWTMIRWDREHRDQEDLHADGDFPGYVPEISSWVDAQAYLHVTGLRPGDSYQIQYQLHDWEDGASAREWTEVVADLPATSGDQHMVGAVQRHVTAGQHLWVAVKPVAGAGSEPERPAPRAVRGRWTLRQDRA